MTTIYSHPIRTARRDKGLSVMQLAYHAGVSAATVYAIEQGRSQGRVSTLKALAHVLGVPVGDLMGQPSESAGPSV